VLIAAMLLVVGMVGSIALILGLLRANKTARARDTGYFLAQQALDRLEMVPMVGSTGVVTTTGQPAFLSAAFPYAATPFPSEPTCYAMSDDVISDRPIACSAGQVAAFVLRTWTCCSTPTGPANDTIPAGAGCVLLNGQGPISSPDAVPGPQPPPPGATTNPNGAVCFIQAEVTWPEEDPVGNQLVIANAAASFLFNDPPATPAGVSYSNHVWATLVRAQ
jgi:Tfp pilus assembly protein PilV